MFAANNDPRDGAMKIKGAFVNGFIFLFFALSLFLAPTLSLGATYCVNNATDLQNALTTAASNGANDTIQIVQGTYSGNFVYASTEAYGVTIEGGYTSGCASREVDPANTVLDGNATGNVLVLSCPDQAVEFAVDGVTLRNGNTSNHGGGLFAMTDDGEVTLTNNNITGNSAGDGYSLGNGGGVYASGSTTVTLSNNTITGNSAGDGGGVYASGSTTVTLSNNTITGNSAWRNEGGGVYASGFTTVTLSNNTITGNSGQVFGGGVYASVSTTVTLSNNTMTGNSAGDGGGVCVWYSTTVTMTNNTITENSAANNGGGGVCVWYSTTVTLTNNTITGNWVRSTWTNGGGMYVYRPTTVTLTNNTITGNSANSNGGGAYVWLYGNPDTAKIYNNVVYNNNANANGDDLYIQNDGNGDFVPSPVSLYNNDFDQSASGTYIELPFAIDPSNLDNANPLFVNVLANDYHLIPSSPCINAGNNSAPNLPSKDKDGNPRIFGGTVDMGAYEYQPIVYVEPDGLCGGNTPCYSTIQSAIDAASSGSVIKIREGVYNEDPTLSSSKNLTLQGGWDSTFTTQSSNTTINSLTISSGVVTVDSMVIQ